MYIWNAMKTIDSTTLRNNLSDAIKEVNRTGQPLVIKHRLVPKAVLMDIGEYEDYLASQDPEFIKSIAKARAEAKSGQVISLDDYIKENFGSLN